MWASSNNNLNYSNDQGKTWYKINNVNFKNIIRIGSDNEYIYCINNYEIIKINNLSGGIIEYMNKINEINEIKWSSYLSLNLFKNKINEFSFSGGWYIQNNNLIGPKVSDNHNISTFYLDRFGDSWLGTNKGYIFKGSNQLLNMELVFQGLSNSYINDLKIWENKLWVSSNTNYNSSSSINLFDYNNFNFETFSSKEQINFNFDSIYKIQRVLNEWYFLSFDGIKIFDPKKENWFFLNKFQKYFDYNYFNSMANDTEYIYLGTKNGINRFLINSFDFNNWSVSQKIGNIPIDHVFWDGRSLWICSGLRIWRWVKDANFLAEYGSNNSIESDFFSLESSIQSSTLSDDKIFFAEKTSLLILDKINFTWKRVKYNRKLISAQIFEIEYFKLNANEELIWFATNKGVFVINISENYQLDFNQDNGLSSDFVTSIEINENEIWFGTSSGICRFNWLNHLK